MPGVIRQCLSRDPSQRPTFQEIFTTFESKGWNILPGVNAAMIEMSVSEVMVQESRLMASN
jgi:hypothetical protein